MPGTTLSCALVLEECFELVIPFGLDELMEFCEPLRGRGLSDVQDVLRPMTDDRGIRAPEGRTEICGLVCCICGNALAKRRPSAEEPPLNLVQWQYYEKLRRALRQVAADETAVQITTKAAPQEPA